MENQVDVTLTLTALNGDLSIAERVLTLNSKSKTIPVGRASKSVTKGILGAANNAWFDSPVMSRNHATIDFNSEDMTVAIKDIGSMHGTYLNDIELPKNTPTIITGNDVLVFGAEVRRGSEVFPACSFQVTYRSTPYKSHPVSANTYTCPESDVEEDGDENYDEFSEDDLDLDDRENLSSSEDDVSIDPSIELLSTKKSKASDAIDLTGDDYLRNSMSNHVDLTGQTTAELGMMDTVSGHAVDSDDHEHQAGIVMHAGSRPIVLDSEDELYNEDADFSSDLDDQEEEIASADSDRARIYAIFEDNSEISDSQIEDSVDDSDVEDSDAGLELAEPISPIPVTISGLTRYALATDEDPIIHLSKVRTRLELPDSDGEDDESDFSLSEAGVEGMKALYAASSSLPAPDWEDENETGIVQPDDPSTRVFFTSALDLGSSASSIPKNVTEASPAVQQDLLRPVSIARQPSPSDAAMVKSAFLPRKVGIYDLGQTDEYSPQALGEKSGKHAFFAAREVNKAKFGSGELDRALSAFQAANRTANVFSAPSNSRKGAGTPDIAIAISDAAAGKFTRGWTDPAKERLSNFDVMSSKPLVMASGAASKFSEGSMSETTLRKAAPSIPTRDYCSFLDKPDQSLISERAPSPLPDMTSSYSYNTSKDAMLSISAPQHNPRSAIKITDIVEPSPLSNNTNSLKRKVDSISDVTNKELRNWANSNVSSENSRASLSIPIQGKNLNDVSNSTGAPAAKRFKKLLANAGYVALGGATLFAALVATAPELI